jgi:hypothetical protein
MNQPTVSAAVEAMPLMASTETPAVGVNQLTGMTGKVEQERRDMDAAMPGLQRKRDSLVPPGGLMQQITHATNNKGTHVEKLEVNTTQKVDAFFLQDQLEMAAG